MTEINSGAGREAAVEKAIIEPPALFGKKKFSARAIMVSSQKELERLVSSSGKGARSLGRTRAGGLPVYKCGSLYKDLVCTVLPIGAPHAVLVLEELIHGGCRSIVSAGYCGLLVREPGYGKVLIARSAFSGDGCSGYYNPSSRINSPDQELCSRISDGIRAAGFDTADVRVWTTDAFFRETPDAVGAALENGSGAVDMESSALMAAAVFRGVSYASVLLPFDSLASGKWKRLPSLTMVRLGKILGPLAAAIQGA